MAIVVQKHKFSTILLIIITISSSFIPSHQRINWDNMIKLPLKTELIFFFHDIVSGPKPTAVNIVPPKSKYLPTFFGEIFMVDDPLTVGPEMSSGIIGKAQGFYAGASMDAVALLMVMNYVFTDKSEFNGSTLSVMGRNSVFDGVREMSIVGGTGVFQLAKGVARAKTHSFKNNGDAVVEYNVTVYYYG